MKNTIQLKQETIENFHLTEIVNNKNEIELYELAKRSNNAENIADGVLEKAIEIVNGNIFTRTWKNKELQKNLIQSINAIKEISVVNVGLSAICNDLVQMNLDNAEKINITQRKTNQKLNEIYKLIRDFTFFIEKSHKASLLEKLLPAFSEISLSNQDEVRKWLITLTEEIDLQYSVLQEKVDILSKENNYFIEKTNNLKDNHNLKFEEINKNLDTFEIKTQILLKEDEEFRKVNNSLIQKTNELESSILLTSEDLIKKYENINKITDFLNEELKNKTKYFENEIEKLNKNNSKVKDSIESLKNGFSLKFQEIDAELVDLINKLIQRDSEIHSKIVSLNQELRGKSKYFENEVENLKSEQDKFNNLLISKDKDIENLRSEIKKIKIVGLVSFSFLLIGLFVSFVIK